MDYALRAKSIRNKPEVNQRMTRNALLKEYVAEIERLKADVLAAREKNGIFLSEERWQEMTAEQELRDTEMQEAKKQVEIVETPVREMMPVPLRENVGAGDAVPAGEEVEGVEGEEDGDEGGTIDDYMINFVNADPEFFSAADWNV